VVAGIGFNISMNGDAAEDIDQPWVDFQTALGDAVSRNHVAGVLVDHLFTGLQEFQQHGLAHFRDEWRRFDGIAGKPVTLSVDNRRLSGVAVGVDEHGALLVRQGAEVQRFFSGDVSVRLTD
jgi:BirA family biotin operon repressor/biotin-[acetyl-CoA-carboxylase] ligase